MDAVNGSGPAAPREDTGANSESPRPKNTAARRSPPARRARPASRRNGATPQQSRREDLAKAGRGAGWHNRDWDWSGGLYLLEKKGRLRLVEEGDADPEAEALRQLDLARSGPPSVG